LSIIYSVVYYLPVMVNNNFYLIKFLLFLVSNGAGIT